VRAFELHQPKTLSEAVDLAGQYADDDTHMMAGGTSLVLLMQLGLVDPARIILLRNIPELRGIRNVDGGLEIGALMTHRELELAPETATFSPALKTTFGHVATVRIRNQATVGGNLVHADPAQDPPPMLIALGAEVVVQSSAGQRAIPLDAFFVDYLTTVLQPGEILTTIRVPALAPNTRAAYQKFLPRTHDDYATVSVGATLRLDVRNRCADVRIALGGAAGIPLRLRQVEDALRGEELTDARIEDAAALVTDLVDPPDDARGSSTYKRRMARVWTARTLKHLRDMP
jgi:aerobic carbon-monoxide dehydrogenase medium subunit